MLCYNLFMTFGPGMSLSALKLREFQHIVRSLFAVAKFRPHSNEQFSASLRIFSFCSAAVDSN